MFLPNFEARIINQTIKNYTIKDGMITVHLASGKKYEVPYIKENEAKLLERMEKQIL